MKKNNKKIFLLLTFIIMVFVLSGCRQASILLLTFIVMVFVLSGRRQTSRVSGNLSQEADNFNVARKLTVINQRTDTILFQMTGNFSLDNNANNELEIIGENNNGTYYKHFIYLSDEISYIVEDIG